MIHDKMKKINHSLIAKKPDFGIKPINTKIDDFSTHKINFNSSYRPTFLDDNAMNQRHHVEISRSADQSNKKPQSLFTIKSQKENYSEVIGEQNTLNKDSIDQSRSELKNKYLDTSNPTFSNPESDQTENKILKEKETSLDSIIIGSMTEWNIEEIIFIFLGSQQLFMICFLIIAMISFCFKSDLSICLTFTFSITNLINSVIYFLVLLFSFLFIISNEQIDHPTKTILVFLVFFLVYGFNIFWSFILLTISRKLLPSEEENEKSLVF
jgi:ABC-type multidrug transport system fused ATPase/permease subunit